MEKRQYIVTTINENEIPVTQEYPIDILIDELQWNVAETLWTTLSTLIGDKREANGLSRKVNFKFQRL